MYYLELIHKFWIFNQKNHLGAAAVTLYLYLLKTGNESDSYDFRISDVSVSNDLGFTRKTIKQAKEKLRNSGLIQYQTKNGLPCHYKLILNYLIQTSEPEKIQKVKIKIKPASSKLEESAIQPPTVLPIQDFAANFSETDNTKNIPPSLQLSKPITDTKKIPTLEEVLEYAKTLETYDPSLDFLIQEKYENWKNNGWKNTSGRPLTNWKSSIKSILPYLKNTDENNPLSVPSIPNIKRPKL